MNDQDDTKTINFRISADLLDRVLSFMGRKGYTNLSEFIRVALCAMLEADQ